MAMTSAVNAVRGMIVAAAVASVCACSAGGRTHDDHASGRAAPAKAAATLSISTDDVYWAPLALPRIKPGATVAVLKGNLAQPGPFTILIQMPPRFDVPAHWHDADEDIVVLSGSVYMGGSDGKPMSSGNGTLYKKGGKHHLPAKAVHWLTTSDEPAVLKISSVGPFGIHWVDQ